MDCELQTHRRRLNGRANVSETPAHALNVYIVPGSEHWASSPVLIDGNPAEGSGAVRLAHRLPSQPLAHTPSASPRMHTLHSASVVPAVPAVCGFFVFYSSCSHLISAVSRGPAVPCRTVRVSQRLSGESIPKRHPSTSKGAVWMDSAAAPVLHSGRHPPSMYSVQSTPSHPHTLYALYTLSMEMDRKRWISTEWLGVPLHADRLSVGSYMVLLLRSNIIHPKSGCRAIYSSQVGPRAARMCGHDNPLSLTIHATRPS